MIRWFRQFRIRQLEKAVLIVEQRRALAEKHGDQEHRKKMDDRLHHYHRRINRLKFNLSQ